MGDAPAGDPAPSAAQVIKAREVLASAGPVVAEGEREYHSQGCANCHALAAIGAEGKLGPRLDTVTDPVRVTAGNISDPRSDTDKGYEANLMPIDYASRMSAKEIAAVATFIRTASVAGQGTGRGGGG
jgi:mono/diheme cytochrome c family protein